MRRTYLVQTCRLRMARPGEAAGAGPSQHFTMRCSHGWCQCANCAIELARFVQTLEDSYASDTQMFVEYKQTSARLLAEEIGS